MLYRANLGPLLRPGLRKDFRDSYDKWEPLYPYYLKVGTADRLEIEGGMITGFSRLVERPDGGALTYQDPKVGPKTIAFVKEFASGFIITRQSIEDDQYNKANQHAKWLGDAVYFTKEYSAAQLLDDAFTGTYFKGYDGQPLISNAHTKIGTSGTFSNLGQPVQISVTGITNLIDLAQLSTNQNGDPVIVRPNKMVMGNHAADYSRALQIWNSQYEPFTAENQENSLRLRMKEKNGYMPVSVPKMVPYKQSRRSYFLIDDRYNDAHFDVRIPVSFEDTQDFDTSAMKYMARARWAVYFFDWFGWFGANPTS